MTLVDYQQLKKKKRKELNRQLSCDPVGCVVGRHFMLLFRLKAELRCVLKGKFTNVESMMVPTREEFEGELPHLRRQVKVEGTFVKTNEKDESTAYCNMFAAPKASGSLVSAGDKFWGWVSGSKWDDTYTVRVNRFTELVRGAIASGPRTPAWYKDDTILTQLEQFSNRIKKERVEARAAADASFEGSAERPWDLCTSMLC
eukprot:TRINITY_DN58541_c0_g1_i1.p1 TRINITY_DN58541_c0_g1~~TRINITY_DN58541_c0_g1_i1.p1  ORF type:complete len:201 (+),score=9.88 TRINITY_DN58541_c0_g1_i1:663-1265(+)